jgi:hypothetical protein
VANVGNLDAMFEGYFELCFVMVTMSDLDPNLMDYLNYYHNYICW